MPRKRKVATKLIIEPALDTRFQPANASGKSTNLLGIPLSPRKCCGKNVILTPIKKL